MSSTVPVNTLIHKMNSKVEGMRRAAAKGISREDLSFACACFVMFVDVMGTTFVGSVIVPYSLALKKDASYASLLLVVRFACNFLANIYMPIIGDRCGRTIVAIISLAGSAVAYALQACAVVFGFPSNSGWYLLLVGKAVEGLFAGTGPAMMAYTMELSVPRMGLLRIRYAILIAMMFGVPSMLQPIGGSIATFGMHIPYVIMAVVATASIVVVASVMREAKTIRGLQEEGRGFWCDCLAKGKSGHNESDFGLDLSEMDPVDDGSNGVDVHAAKVDESKTSSLSAAEKKPTLALNPMTDRANEAKVGDDGAPAKALEAEAKDEAAAASAGAAECSSAEEETTAAVPCFTRMLRTPYMDPTLLLFATGTFAFGLCMPALILIPPLVFAHPDFGIAIAGDEVATQAKIAQAVSLTVTGSSVFTVIGLLVVYPLLTRVCKVTDFTILIIFGSAASIIAGIHGFANSMWTFTIVQALYGACVGPFLGGFVNCKNPYVLNLFPKDMAASNSIYQNSQMLGMVAGPFLFQSIFQNAASLHATFWGVTLSSVESKRIDARYAFAAIGVLIFMASMIIAIAERIMALRVRLHKKNVELAGMSAAVRKLQLQTNALTPEKFTSKLMGTLRETFDSRNYHLWNGAVQETISKRLLFTLPLIAPWNDASGGQEHVFDIATLLLEMDDLDAVHALNVEILALKEDDGESTGTGGGGGGAYGNLDLYKVAEAVHAKLKARLEVVDSRMREFHHRSSPRERERSASSSTPRE